MTLYISISNAWKTTCPMRLGQAANTKPSWAGRHFGQTGRIGFHRPATATLRGPVSLTAALPRCFWLNRVAVGSVMIGGNDALEHANGLFIGVVQNALEIDQLSLDALVADLLAL